MKFPFEVEVGEDEVTVKNAPPFQHLVVEIINVTTSLKDAGVRKILQSKGWTPPNGVVESGFIDLPKSDMCNHPEHHPPMHMLIPQGKAYRHVCPACGHIQTIQAPQMR